MNGMDPINGVENALRDLVEVVMTRKIGPQWISSAGVSVERVEKWKERRAEEPKRRPGGSTEDRLLYYSDFSDVVSIIQKNWSGEFKTCIDERKRFDVYTDRLAAFRNPDAHSRMLRPFEEHLVEGICGELIQEITVYLSSGAGGPEPEYFARIEEVTDTSALVSQE